MTDAQRQAANPHTSAWVSASAGTGKTKVLTDRVLRLLLEGVPASHILCLTFTKAAAGEMETRLHRALAEWATSDTCMLEATLSSLLGADPDEAQLLRARHLFAEVLEGGQGVQLQTIHAFCQALLARFPLEAGLPPHFQVADDRASAALIEEARRRLLSESGNADASLTAAFERISVRVHESQLHEVLQGLLGERARLQELLGRPDGRARMIADIYRCLGVASGATEENMLEEQCCLSPQRQERLWRLVEMLAQGNDKEQTRSAQIQCWLAADEGGRAQQFEGYQGLFLTQNEEARKSSGIATKPLRDRFPDIEVLIEAEQRSLCEWVEAKRALAIAKDSEAMVVVADAWLHTYRHLKRHKGLLDYDDLIEHALALLTQDAISPWVLYKLDGGLDHILVDEAQDTSPAQWELVRAITEEFFTGDTEAVAGRSVFAVGDEKQSIYRFQGADPDAFQRMQDHFAERAAHTRAAFLAVDLDRSFRSAPAVLRAVDAVFSQARCRDSLYLTADLHHQAHRNDAAGRVEVWPVLEADEASDEGPWPLPLHRHDHDAAPDRHAGLIADEVCRWLRNRESLPSRAKPIGAGDIMILVQRRGPLYYALHAALAGRGIAVAGADRMRLQQHIAVQDLLALASFTLLPEDDYTLACVLKSPLCGIDEETLFALRYQKTEHSLWHTLMNERMSVNYIDRSYETLKWALDRSDFMTPFAFFAAVLDVRGSRKAFRARLGGAVDDILDAFLAMALQYETEHVASLQGFVHWFQERSFHVKRDMEHAGDAIRILTVHGAKGLQAPIVIIADAADVSRDRQKFYWAGEGTSAALLWSSSAARDSALLADLRAKARQEVWEESMRLLYVAMTRAEDRLLITAMASGRKIPEECWYDVLMSGLKNIMQDTKVDINADIERVWLLEDPPLGRGAKPAAGAVPSAVQEPPSLPEAWYGPPRPERALPPEASQRWATAFESHRSTNENKEIGNVIHAIMEYNIAYSEITDQLIQRLLGMGGRASAVLPLEKIASHVKNALESIEKNKLNSGNVLREVQVSGCVGAVHIHRRIDYLVVREEEVVIVDFKTSARAPHDSSGVSASVLRQMAEYQSLILQLYRDKSVRCLLLWTATGAVIPLPDHLLEAAMPPLDSAASAS